MSYREGKPVEPLISIVSSTVVALHRETGRQLWQYQAPTRIVRVVHASERIFLLDYDCVLHCLRAYDGLVLGTIQVDERSYLGCALLLGPNGELYVGTSNSVVALDPTGREMWRFKHGPVSGSSGSSLAGLALPGVAVQPDFKD
jgi:outer membrane protein assembly factor BamB